MNKQGYKRTLIPLVGVVLGMAAMGWAAVPLYDLFCRGTGYGGTTRVASDASAVIRDRTGEGGFDESGERRVGKGECGTCRTRRCSHHEQKT